MSVKTKLVEVEAALDRLKPIRHKIGCTRTIQTAILVCLYIGDQIPQFKDKVRYIFTDPTTENGFWSADIIIDIYKGYDDDIKQDLLSDAVSICRSFTAGRGEIW